MPDPYPDSSIKSKRHVLDKFIEWMMIVLLAFMPLAFGAVHAWSEGIVVFIAMLMVLCMGLRLIIAPRQKFRRSWTYLPLVAFLLFVGLQIVPLPNVITELIAPHTVDSKAALQGGLPDSQQSTISFYPYATWHDLRILLAVAAVFIVTYNIFREPEQIFRLLACLAVIGAAVAILALLQTYIGNGRIFWLIDTPIANRSGPFVNYNHFGQYMLMSIGVTLALLLLLLRQSNEFGGQASFSRGIPLIGQTRIVVLALAAGVVIEAIALINSGSRGAIVAMVVAGLIIAVLGATHKRIGMWPSVVVAGGMLVTGLALTLAADVGFERLKLFSKGVDFGARQQLALDSLEMFQKHPLTGIGQGTFENVYPMYRQLGGTAIAAHADTDYPQLFAETGVVGALCLLGFLSIVFFGVARMISRKDQPLLPVVHGLIFAASAILFHSAVDFGQRLPANACFSAVIFGLLLSISSMAPETNQKAEQQSKTHRFSRFMRPAGLAFAAVLLVVLGVSANSCLHQWQAQRHWTKAKNLAQYIRKERLAKPRDHAALIAHVSSALKHAPDNVKYRYHLSYYQWRAVQLVEAAQIAEDKPLKRWDTQIDGILRNLMEVRRQCPTYARAAFLEGVIRRNRGELQRSAQLIEQAYRLNSNDPNICSVAASIQAEQEQFVLSFSRMQRAVQLDPNLFGKASMMFRKAGRPDLVVDLAGNDYRKLFILAGQMANDPASSEQADIARKTAISLLEAHYKAGNASAKELATLAAAKANDGDLEAAQRYYQFAIDKEYDRVNWHLARANALIGLNRPNEAIRELRICIRLVPNHSKARKLLSQLNDGIEPGA